MNGHDVTETRKYFERFIKLNECWDGQICVSVKNFRKELMIPILARMKVMEKSANE